jgi:hypothetical protein
MSHELSFTKVIRNAPDIVILNDMPTTRTSFNSQSQDKKFYSQPYGGKNFIEGSGSADDPYCYADPAPVSPHYCIIDLWFHLRDRGNVMIEVNDTVFELHQTGVKSSNGCFTRLLPK